MDLLNWIDGAQTSLYVHLYILQSSELMQALIDAHDRGVDVVVVLNEPEDWWNSNDKQGQEAYAYALKDAGLSVHWFGGSGDDPYLYLHAKVAVRDDASVWIGSGNWKASSLPYDGDREIATGESLSTVSNLPTMFEQRWRSMKSQCTSKPSRRLHQQIPTPFQKHKASTKLLQRVSQEPTLANC